MARQPQLVQRKISEKTGQTHIVQKDTYIIGFTDKFEICGEGVQRLRAKRVGVRPLFSPGNYLGNRSIIGPDFHIATVEPMILSPNQF